MGISLSRKASDLPATAQSYDPEAVPSPRISGCAPANNFDLSYDPEAVPSRGISGCAPANNYDLESPHPEYQVVRPQLTSPQAVTWRSYDRETETWIREKAVAIDIPEESLVDPRLASAVSIFRVPNFLKELKNRAYVPQIVSLGPYHSNGENLSRMDYNKKRALRRMMTRFNDRYDFDSDKMEFSFRAIDQIFHDKEKVRNNYEEEIDCNPQRLVVMLTLDGCFILEILRTLGGNNVSREVSDKYEPIFERRKIDFTGFEILNDILKLENQIPLIVLRKLLQLELNCVDHAEKFLFDLLVKAPGNKFYPFDYEHDIRKASRALRDEQVPHILGLLYSLIVTPHSDDGGERANQIDSNGKEKSGKEDKRIPTAAELSNAGIKFERRDGGIKKIYFDPKEATMYLPPINVTDHTEVLFRNLVALELCKASGMNYVTCYLSLMDNLIDTEKDVALLRNRGIVKNYLGSDTEVAELFNGLCKGVTLPREYVFKNLQDDVMEHYRNKVKGWIAQFKENYFSSPWKFSALLGAIIALVLTLLQTIYAMK